MRMRPAHWNAPTDDIRQATSSPSAETRTTIVPLYGGIWILNNVLKPLVKLFVRCCMGSRSPGFLQSSEYSGHQYANVFYRPCGTLARCPEVADPWARMEKPERFARDVRVIHPVKAQKDKARRHRAENGPSKVPAANRAPDFRVSLRR